jgi:Flp pilus assembly protein TadG
MTTPTSGPRVQHTRSNRHAGPRRWRGRDRERGSATAEAALATPLLILLALVAVGFGRTASTRIEVNSAARQAARAASLAPDPDTAAAHARATAQTALAEDKITCADLRVTVDTTDFTPGGTVTVTITCTTRLTDVAMPGLPGHATLQARFVSPVDVYRTQPRGFTDSEGSSATNPSGGGS